MREGLRTKWIKLLVPVDKEWMTVGKGDMDKVWFAVDRVEWKKLRRR